jgi:DNA (cytosine-5)-methyltransferase 1
VKYEKDVPTPADVLALRESLQAREHLGITAAQDRCAEMLHTSRRAWQQWEHGDRKMHPAFWELIRIKTEGETRT